MNTFVLHFLESYGYSSIKEFFFSMCPSFKYELNWASFFVSAILGAFAEWIGIRPALAVAMLIAVIAETVTGIRASKKMGRKFESFRFSRCILKLAIWLSILYIVNAFYHECDTEKHVLSALASLFFMIVKLSIMIAFCIEHLVSILENLAVIDGREKDYLVNKLQEYWNHVTGTFKNKMK